MIRIIFICLALVCGFRLAQAAPNNNAAPPAPTQPGAPFRPPVTSPYTITPLEWQELTAARASAIKANPGLMQKSIELAARMRALQQKLDAAILKINPQTAPLIAQLERGMPGQPVPMPSPRPAASPSLPPSPTHAH